MPAMPTAADPAPGLLAVLLASGEWATHDQLAQLAGLSVEQVNATIAQLARDGCEISHHPGVGVRLNGASLACWADFIEARHRDRLGRAVHVYRQTDSTQDIARRMVESARHPAALHGTLIAADHQAAGRGRLGRRWYSRPGEQLLVTLIIHHDAPIDRLMLGVALGVAAGIESVLDRPVGLRWPNDCLVDGRKLAGVLIERARGCALVGVGINVGLDPTQLPDGLGELATSFAHLGQRADRLSVLDAVLSALDRSLAEDDNTALVAAWRERSVLDQQRITVETDGRRLTGRVIDIDPSRGLLLEVERGPIVALHAATTSLVLAQK